MFEFLFALFGSIGIGARASHEKAVLKEKSQETKQWIDTMKDDLQKWERKVIDEKREYEVSKIQSTDEIYLKMHDRIKNEAKIETVADDMVRLGILAQDGKIPQSIARNGIRSYGVWDYEEKLRWSAQRKFLVWYDRELGHNGIEEPILFVNGTDESKIRHNIGLARPISTGTQMIGGLYFWEPMRFHVN